METSRRLLERSKHSLAGGVNSNDRAVQRPVPLFFEKAVASRIYDVDGNEYIDYVLGWGPLILGHNHPSILDAVRSQIDRGVIYGGQHELEIKLSEKLQRIIPCAEKVTYNTTGTEAVAVALKLARAHTGRQKIVRFEGHYHGWLDNIHVSSDFQSLADAGSKESPRGVLTRGQPRSVLGDVVVLPWNDVRVLEETISARRGEIAAVIAEPVMQRGVILPKSGYLETLRELCTRHDVVLIFDEVVTGFRIALGGAQQYFGVIPDLTVLSKALGGGFPISCVAGKEEILDLISRQEVTHAGTFSGSPVCMAAAYATILELERNGAKVYDDLFDLGERLAQGIKEIGLRLKFNLLVQVLGPIFYVFFTDLQSVSDYRDLLKTDRSAYGSFAAALVEKGILTLTSHGRWYLSAVHSKEEIDHTLRVIEETLRERIAR